MNEHVAELAGLYAAGSLNDRERAQVDAHLASCNECAARVGEAESAIAALIVEREPSPALDRRMRATFAMPSLWQRWAPALAAAFVLGLLPSIWFALAARNAGGFAADREAAVHAMVGSHFAHAQFTALTPDAPKAKVIYARTGTWRFIVVDAGHSYTVAAQSDTGVVRLGNLHVQGGAAELFLPNAPRARTLLLLDGARPVARATLP